MEEVAISLSGGGFRAAMFHLGTLSYLNHLKLPDGRPFLGIVNTISTISGGTITGLWYMMNYCANNDIGKAIRELYTLLLECELPSRVLDAYLDRKNQNASLIKEMIKLYDEYFFHGETFGKIMEKVEDGHIHHFSANGTDFSTGLAFRFQASRAIKNAEPNYKYGLIGNKRHQLERNIASKIKLSEILAVSSCFPGGFEPIVFPNDFAFFEKGEWPVNKKDFERFILMDGGIVDNQGIEPLLLANEQMAKDHPCAKENNDCPCHDLIIVSDVSSSEIKSRLPFESSCMSQLNLASIELCLFILVLICTFISIVLCVMGLHFFGGFLTFFCFLLMFLRYILCKIEKAIKRALQTKVPFHYDWEKMKNLSLSKVIQLLGSRVSSLLDLTQIVFMKPIRQMRYRMLYHDLKWENRLISNNLSELSRHGSWKTKENYPQNLIPSNIMKDNADKACTMGTTLWFTDSDKKQGIPKALFSSGQYTICMNLLEYIYKLEKKENNTTDTHQLIKGCKQQLINDWECFQNDPCFLFDKMIEL